MTTKEKSGGMEVEGAYITGTHPYSFRSGTAGLITGVKIVTPDGLEPRACYEITYPDGFIDYTAIKTDLTYKIHSRDGFA